MRRQPRPNRRKRLSLGNPRTLEILVGAIPAWEAVERKQKQEANAWWLVAQSDHAALSGDLAANLSSPFFPKLDIDVVHAISLHDAGWAHFDGGDEHANGTRPGEIFWAPKIS